MGCTLSAGPSRLDCMGRTCAIRNNGKLSVLLMGGTSWAWLPWAVPCETQQCDRMGGTACGRDRMGWNLWVDPRETQQWDRMVGTSRAGPHGLRPHRRTRAKPNNGTIWMGPVGGTFRVGSSRRTHAKFKYYALWVGPYWQAGPRVMNPMCGSARHATA